MTLAIYQQHDWQKLVDLNLQTVVDPMVFRCGELFLRSARGVTDQAAAWSFLDKNLLAIGSFFDAMILNDRLPVFNYTDTFDIGLDFDGTTLSRVNEHEMILHPIDVTYGTYMTVKQSALGELAKLYDGEQRIPAKLAQEIFNELDESEYRWNPSLGDLEGMLNSDLEKRLAKFLLGGLIFGGYAQIIGGEHVIQPKRSRLMLAAQMGRDLSPGLPEASLFEELKKRANAPCDDLPWRPSFFPYLLDRAKSPMGVLWEALVLRRSSEVREYRQWLGEVLDDWKRHGKIAEEKRRDVKAIAERVDRLLGVVSSAPKFELKVTVADAISSKPPGAIDLMPTVKGLWGWFLDNLPGKRYRKLLARAVVREREYIAMTNAVRSTWQA
jgi:hypothetical protein